MDYRGHPQVAAIISVVQEHENGDEYKIPMRNKFTGGRDEPNSFGLNVTAPGLNLGYENAEFSGDHA